MENCFEKIVSREGGEVEGREGAAAENECVLVSLFSLLVTSEVGERDEGVLKRG